MKQYIVDAFTSEPFSGNPAAVCVMEEWPSEESMMKLAMENNLSETAFIVKEDKGYHLLQFNTLSGLLTVTRKDNLYEMDFPTYDLKEIPVTDDMERAFGVRPVKAFLGLDLVCVFEKEEQVREMDPDQAMLMKIEGRLQNATALGRESDCVSRSFAPKLAIAEDPVCGSAHCQIADYWSTVLGKMGIHAYQASKRGGHLYCEMLGNGRMSISGEAALVAISDIKAELI